MRRYVFTRGASNDPAGPATRDPGRAGGVMKIAFGLVAAARSFGQLTIKPYFAAKTAYRIDRGELKTYLLLMAVFLGVGLLFRLHHLSDFITPDEYKWLYQRTDRFFDGLRRLALADLHINDKPGVTTVWINKLGTMFDQPMDRAELSQALLFRARLPFVLVNIAMIAFLANALRRLTNPKIALLFTALLVLSPTIVGMSQIINPDAFSWFFPIAFLLTFSLYLRDFQRRDFFLCALFFSLGVLTKFNFLIVLPLVPVIIALLVIFGLQREPENLRRSAAAAAQIYLVGYVITVVLWPIAIYPSVWLNQTVLNPAMKPAITAPALGLLLGYLLFPAWAHKHLVRLHDRRFMIISLCAGALMALSLYALITPTVGPLPKGTYFRDLTAAETLVWAFKYQIFSIPTFALALYLSALILLVRFPAFLRGVSPTNLFILAASLVFIMAYVGGMAIGRFGANTRYQAALYPFIFLIGTTVFHDCLKRMKARSVLKFPWAPAFLIASTVSLAGATPFYLTYMNALAPKGILLFDGWGYGGYEAAQYLNAKPNAQDLVVYPSYHGFVFFNGTSAKIAPDPFLRPRLDYVVVFRQGAGKRAIGRDKRLDDYYRNEAEAEYVIEVRGVPMVKVVKVPEAHLKSTNKKKGKNQARKAGLK
jgi:hypothetical protein